MQQLSLFEQMQLLQEDKREVVIDEAAPLAEAPPASTRLADIARLAAMKAERTVITETLGQTHWNRRRAAEQLGVSYKTLLNKIKECGISRT